MTERTSLRASEAVVTVERGHHRARSPSTCSARWPCSGGWPSLPAGVAFADPAGPTDYETTITSVEPATPGIEVSVVGGDSFLRVVAEPGVDVVVLGYQQEPYLHIRADGVVEENQRSPATYLNADRYGTGAPPAGADPVARARTGSQWARVVRGPGTTTAPTG